MSRYSRIKEVSTKRSQSIDFSDLSFPPKAPKPKYLYGSNPPDSKIQENKIIPERNIGIHASIQVDENEDSVGEVFGVILSRKCSLSSTSSHNYIMCEKETASLQSAVKRVLSMKRSSSISEGYCRIHLQCGHPTDDTYDDNSATLIASKTRSIKRKGKILRACRRIFGF
ncbi:hypothetical protein ACH5RR_033686 [Cinchona calisaya]|uniref:Uncharacterized protein n=1 Tax=Cinchona calisaya TaxID=153742 RepID=A0ABD2YDC9_9GENT